MGILYVILYCLNYTQLGRSIILLGIQTYSSTERCIDESKKGKQYMYHRKLIKNTMQKVKTSYFVIVVQVNSHFSRKGNTSLKFKFKPTILFISIVCGIDEFSVGIRWVPWHLRFYLLVTLIHKCNSVFSPDISFSILVNREIWYTILFLKIKASHP